MVEIKEENGAENPTHMVEIKEENGAEKPTQMVQIKEENSAEKLAIKEESGDEKLAIKEESGDESDDSISDAEGTRRMDTLNLLQNYCFTKCKNLKEEMKNF